MTNEKNTTRCILWDLNRLPGFNFMEYTYVKDLGEGKKDLFMSLEGQKTWFRLACPNGGLGLNALRVTDTMAIFEARVFADVNDRSPLASFTATKKVDKATGDAYIRTAQDAALEEALKSAGFCIQTSVLARVARDAQPAHAGDAGQPAEAPGPSPAPVQAGAPVRKAEGNAPPQADAPAQKDEASAPPPVDKAAQQPKPQADSALRPAPVGPPPHGDTASRPAPVGPRPHAAPAPENKDAAPVVDINTRQPVAAENQSTGMAAAETPPEPESAPAPETPAQPAPVTYTNHMTVEEITARMTLEQAKAIKVPGGTCKGWTLEQVAKDRPSSLKWLRYTAPFADNELKAAADIVLNDLELKMAG